MKGFPVIVATILFGFLSAACVLALQEKPAPSAKYPYDVSKEVTVTGRIQGEKDYRCPVTGTLGAHVTLQVATGTMEVHLAPASFMKDYGIDLHAGEQAEIVGVKIDFEGRSAVLARTVTVDNDTYTFRDNKGKPLW
jgi:DNA/RNA endonuclease YhcR with UshA esterase domain